MVLWSGDIDDQALVGAAHRHVARGKCLRFGVQSSAEAGLEIQELRRWWKRAERAG